LHGSSICSPALRAGANVANRVAYHPAVQLLDEQNWMNKQ
jgi:hypothetical protein